MENYIKLILTPLLCLWILSGYAGGPPKKAPIYVASPTELNLAPQSITIPAGTPLQLAVAEEYDVDDLKVGSTIKIIATLPVIIKGSTVIPTDAIGEAVVTRKESRGIMGKKGMIEIQAKSIEAIDGSRVPLHGVPLQIKGKGTWPLGLVFLIIGIGNFIAGIIVASIDGFFGGDFIYWGPWLLSGLLGIGLSLIKGKKIIIPFNSPLSGTVSSDTDIRL